MPISEQEIVQVFHTLSNRFSQVHHPAIQNMWTNVLNDVQNLSGELVGADVQVIERLIQDLTPLVNRAIQAFENTGPALAAHAAKLESAFGGLQL